MTHFATADELGDDYFPHQLERLHGVRGALPRAASRTSSSTPPTARPPSASRSAHFDMVRCGVAIYGLDPFQEDPAQRGLEPALTLRLLRRRGAPLRAGRQRRLRPPLAAPSEPTWVGTIPIGYGDGWRRALHEQRRRADRRAPLPGGRHRQHGQHHRRPRTRHRRRRRARPSMLIGAQGDERITAEELARRHRHDQLRDHLRADRRASAAHWSARVNAPSRRSRSDSAASRPVLAARSGAGATRTASGSSAARCATRCSRPAPLADLDLAVAGDAAEAARAVAKAARRATRSRCPRSSAPGAWSATAGSATSRRCRATRIEDDLALRDFTVNAMALPLFGGTPDRSRSAAWRDLAARDAAPGRAATPTSATACARCAWCASRPSSASRPTRRPRRPRASGRPRVIEAAGERVFAELRRIVARAARRRGAGAGVRARRARAVLPELEALRGIEQSHFHHLDVYDHTIEVLTTRYAEIDVAPGRVLPRRRAPSCAQVLDEPLGDELTRGQALRFAALLHDIGKADDAPAHRQRARHVHRPRQGRRRHGAQDLHAACAPASACASSSPQITRHHLVLGFLVHERPLSQRAVYRYLKLCSPVEVEVTLLTCADRIATRGKNAEAAIEAHLELARELMTAALRWRADGPPRPPLRGDELARRARHRARAPISAGCSAELEEASYAGEVTSADQAVEYARRLRENQRRHDDRRSRRLQGRPARGRRLARPGVRGVPSARDARLDRPARADARTSSTRCGASSGCTSSRSRTR